MSDDDFGLLDGLIDDNAGDSENDCMPVGVPKLQYLNAMASLIGCLVLPCVGGQASEARKQEQPLPKNRSLNVVTDAGSEFSRSVKSSIVPSRQQQLAPVSGGGHRVSVSRSSAVADGDDLYDPYSKLRIKNRIVSKNLMQERMSGRKVLIVDEIEQNIRNNDIAGDWVVAAVFVEKQDAKTSANGKKYCTVRLSNLRDCTVNLMLWDQAFAKHWKQPVGTVVAVLNPELLKPTQKTSSIGLKIDNPDKLMVIGTSNDLGFCKSRKKDGCPCTMVINRFLE